VRDQRGFTLIELMITVAVITILATIAIPFFTGQSRKSKAKSEVSAMFAELTAKEEAFKMDHGFYFPFGIGTGGTTAACPATPLPTLQDASACPGGAWTEGLPSAPLRVVLPETKLRCSYELTSGLALSAAPATPGTLTMQVGLPNASPPAAWFFAVASCDMDGVGIKSTYFTSSMDSSLQILNEGS
jgi:prepilin-type N-terminal cleavage/methylation domain-containing protein